MLVDSGAAGQPIRQRLAVEALHDEKVDAVLVADVVEGADVRMIQRGDRLRFALEPRPANRDRKLRGRGP